MADFDVLICGGGLVGLTLANALGRSNLKVAIIDGNAEPTLDKHEADQSPELDGHQLNSGFAPRVSAINVASKRILDKLGAWQSIERLCPLDSMSVRDANGSAHISFSAADIKLESLGYIVENRQILAALAGRLKTHKNVTAYWNTSLESINQDDDVHYLKVKHGQVDEITCHLLVGADGGNSRIRELSNLKILSWPYGHEALVTTIQTEKPHGSIARQWFTSEGPLAFLPLSEPNLCSIVWSLKDVAENKTSSGRDFCRALEEASEGELGKVQGIDERFSFPLIQKHAYRYTKQNLVLIGDAAHTIHPLAGQGANLGFADADALAMELMQAKFSEKGITDTSLLRRYELARKPHNLLMASVMEALKRFYGSEDPGVAWLRNTIMKVANENTVLKSMMTRLASGL